MILSKNVEMVNKIARELELKKQSAWCKIRTKSGDVWVGVKDYDLGKIYVFKTKDNDDCCFEIAFKETPLFL